MPKIKYNLAGVTMTEVLLSIALIAILAGIAVPVYQFFQVRNDLDVSTNIIAQSLRRAQTLSGAMDGDETWGVKLQSGSIVIFKGANYVSRDTTSDELYDMATTVTPSGITEIVFAKFTGAPSVTGVITLTSSNAEIRTITINAKGMVD
jgi:Tfp pilus assembly protein FimT